MCKNGDIILIKQYKDHGTMLPKHSFVVISDECGTVCGLPFDFIALVMSSFKDGEQRKKKMRFPGNFPVTAEDKYMSAWANEKDGYIKAEQFYYFKKNKIDYSVIGSLTEETFEILLDFIESFGEKNVEIDQIIDNL